MRDVDGPHNTIKYVVGTFRQLETNSAIYELPTIESSRYVGISNPGTYRVGITYSFIFIR